MSVLHSAARSGDVARLTAALEAGSDPDELDDLGQNPLTAAAAADRAAAVDLLLTRGADPDLAGPDGETPLSVASARGWLEVVARLLQDPRTDPTRRGERGWDPLTAAAFAGHTTVVAALVADARTRAGARDGQGRTALWWAATGGRDEAARLLADIPGPMSPTTTAWIRHRQRQRPAMRASPQSCAPDLGRLARSQRRRQPARTTDIARPTSHPTSGRPVA